MEITDLDRRLYNKYKKDILSVMQGTLFNLSEEITKLLGPYYYLKRNVSKQPPYYGLIEQKAHSYTGVDWNGNKEDLIKKAIDYLNELLRLDPWAAKQSISFQYDNDNNGNDKIDVINARVKGDFNEEYEKKLLINKETMKSIFPSNGYTFNGINGNDDRLHLPPAIFYKKQSGQNEYRFQGLFDEIGKHCPSVSIKIEGENSSKDVNCLYVLSLSYQCMWGTENGKLKFPTSLKTWYSNTLAKYCDYYIVVDKFYCNINKDTEFQNIPSGKICMCRSEKKYEYRHGSNGIKHILIFDNYQKINLTGGAVNDANTAGG